MNSDLCSRGGCNATVPRKSPFKNDEFLRFLWLLNQCWKGFVNVHHHNLSNGLVGGLKKSTVEQESSCGTYIESFIWCRFDESHFLPKVFGNFLPWTMDKMSHSKPVHTGLYMQTKYIWQLHTVDKSLIFKPWRRGLVVLSPPATYESGAMGREIESRQGIGWYLNKKKF
jgi:hypothetical protein